MINVFFRSIFSKIFPMQESIVSRLKSYLSLNERLTRSSGTLHGL